MIGRFLADPDSYLEHKAALAALARMRKRARLLRLRRDGECS
jgi:hypothetical protein